MGKKIKRQEINPFLSLAQVIQFAIVLLGKRIPASLPLACEKQEAYVCSHRAAEIHRALLGLAYDSGSTSHFLLGL